MALPIFLTRRNKYRAGLAAAAMATVLYLTANHYHLIAPVLLPMTWIDRSVPFVPGTVWIYTSEYIFFAMVYVLTRDMANTNKYLYSFLALQITSVAIFWFWPTTYPRGDYPLPDDLGALTYYLFSSLRETDTPTNCAPSLHVSSCYLSSFIFLDEQRGKFPFFFLWASSVAVSTLTTKQHYLIDVVLGFMMAVIFYWIFHRLIPYRTGAQAKR